MNICKGLAFVPLALLIACSGDDSSPTTPSTESSSSEGTPGIPDGGNPGDGGNAPAAVSLPSTANGAIPDAQYPIWKSRWVISMAQEVAGGSTMDYSFYSTKYPNAIRVRWDTSDDNCLVDGLTSIDGKNLTEMMNKQTGCSVSEGIGYGMLISLFNNDQTVFDGLWAYNQGARGFSGGNLMPWRLASFNRVLDATSALDADLDIASALILAYYKWGNQAYLDDAKNIVNTIYELGIHPDTKLLLPGPNWKLKDTYNLSYFSPVAFRLFAKVDQAHPWNEVLDAHYAYMQKVQDAGATKAVFPDWSNAAGEAYYAGSSGIAKKTYMLYFQESVRIPWRIAWDYYWFADERAGAILKKLGDFVAAKSNNDPAQLPQYAVNYLDGTDAINPTNGEHYLGAACLSGLGVNAAWADACTSYFNGFEMSTTAGYSGNYFKQILQMMYSSLLNGKFVKPNL